MFLVLQIFSITDIALALRRYCTISAEVRSTQQSLLNVKNNNFHVASKLVMVVQFVPEIFFLNTIDILL